MSRGKQVDQMKLDQLVTLLIKERTVDELMDKLEVSRSTVYRYLDRLQEQGTRVVGSVGRPTRYILA